MVRRKLGINRRPAAPPPPLPTASPQILENPRIQYSLRIPHHWKVLRRSEVLLFAISHALQDPHNNHLSTILFQTQINLHPGSWRGRSRNAHTLLAVMLSSATSLGQTLPRPTVFSRTSKSPTSKPPSISCRHPYPDPHN